MGLMGLRQGKPRSHMPPTRSMFMVQLRICLAAHPATVHLDHSPWRSCTSLMAVSYFCFCFNFFFFILLFVFGLILNLILIDNVKLQLALAPSSTMVIVLLMRFDGVYRVDFQPVS